MSTGGPLGLLGLGARAGSLVVGVNGVRAALRRGDIALVVAARDCSARTEDKVLRLARGKQVPVLVGPMAEQLGARIGREAVQVVGVRDARLAAGMLAGGGQDIRRM